jgi:hypothetical protein
MIEKPRRRGMDGQTQRAAATLRQATEDTRTQATDAARTEAEAYRHGEERPLGGYTAVMAVFVSLIVGAAGLVAATGRRLPERIGPYDVFLLAAGSHKLSRILTKDAVTSPLRAPFTRYSDSGGPAEVMEEVRDGGTFRHAVGELITCPFCLDMWVATALAIGLLFAPRVTGVVTATFTALTGADLLQLGYAVLQGAASRAG